MNDNENNKTDQDNLSEPLWNREQAAKFLNYSPGTLAVWDCTKRYDLKPIKIGRAVRYSPSHLREFVSTHFLRP